MCVSYTDAILVTYKNRLPTFIFVTAAKCQLLVHPDFTFVTLYTKPPKMGGYIISPSQQFAPNPIFEVSRHFGTSVECLKFTKNALLQGACPLQSGKFLVLTEIANT